MKRMPGVDIPMPGVDDYWKIVIEETAETDRVTALGLQGIVPGIQGPVEDIFADNFDDDFDEAGQGFGM